MTPAEMASAQGGGTASPFPPYYSAGPFTWKTPLFISPTALLAVIIILGHARYMQTRANPWLDTSGQSQRRLRLSALSKLIVAISLTILMSFLGEAAVLVTQAILESYWTSTVLAYYIAISWLAWAISLAYLTDEIHKFTDWNWVQYAFWMAAAFGDTVVGWLWAVGILRPKAGMIHPIHAYVYISLAYFFMGANLGTVFTVYDYALLGLFITRYILELLTVVLCVVQMFTRSHDETHPLLSSGTTTTYGTVPGSSEAQVPKKESTTFSDFSLKMRKLLPYVWPHKSRWLQFLVLVCFLLMSLGLAVNALTPIQVGKIVNSFNDDRGTCSFITSGGDVS